MRVAFFAPLAPLRGGVVDYSEELLPHLAQHCSIDIYTRDGLTPANASLARQFRVFGHRAFPEHDRRTPYDQVIYQLGCSADHVPDYENLLRRPGLSVLHELNLSGIIGAQTFGRGRPFEYVKAVWANEGIGAAAEVVWRFARTRQFPDYLRYDFNRLALKHSVGLIVHNRYMQQKIEERLRRLGIRRSVHLVRMGVPPAPEIGEADTRRARRELNLADDAFVIGSFGIVHESKGIDLALSAFKRLLSHVPQATYLLVGEMASSLLAQAIEGLSLGDCVRMTGHVALPDFYRYAAATNVCINLRVPRTGGTSASRLRLMSVGRPVIVSNQAQFAEIPDDACLKAEAGNGAEDSVLAHLLDMAAHPDKARQIGERARHFVERSHSLGQAAQGYWGALRASIRVPAGAYLCVR